MSLTVAIFTNDFPLGVAIPMMESIRAVESRQTSENCNANRLFP